MIVSGTIVTIGITLAGVLLALITLAVLSAAQGIDAHPRAVSRSAKSWSSPTPSARLFVLVCWVMYVIGVVLTLFADTLLGKVFGIAAIFAALLFTSTALFLCVAVISALDKKSVIGRI